MLRRVGGWVAVLVLAPAVAGCAGPSTSGRARPTAPSRPAVTGSAAPLAVGGAGRVARLGPGCRAMDGLTEVREAPPNAGLVHLALCAGRLTATGGTVPGIGQLTARAGRAAVAESLVSADRVRRVVDGWLVPVRGLSEETPSFEPALNDAGDLVLVQPSPDRDRESLVVFAGRGDARRVLLSTTGTLYNPQWDPDGSVTVWVEKDPQTRLAQLTRIGPDGSVRLLGPPRPEVGLVRLGSGGYAAGHFDEQRVSVMTVLTDDGRARGQRRDARPLWSDAEELWVVAGDGTISVLDEVTLAVRRSMPSPVPSPLFGLAPATGLR